MTGAKIVFVQITHGGATESHPGINRMVTFVKWEMTPFSCNYNKNWSELNEQSRARPEQRYNQPRTDVPFRDNSTHFS